MIISCPECGKKFEIDASLIPQSGRLLQCGSCENKWFYKKQVKVLDDIKNKKVLKKKDAIEKSKLSTEPSLDNEKKKTEKVNQTKNDYIKTKKLPFLNLILIFIISFIAILIIIDTFKDQISIFIPHVHIFLENFYETLEDIFSFMKDLIS